MATDVAIVIGHHPEAQGARLTLAHRGLTEHAFWSPFARELAHSLAGVGVDAVVIRRPNPDPDEALVRRINATKAKCAIELHFNAFEDNRAHGTEMLHWHRSGGGKDLAELLCDRAVHALRTRRRGLVPVQAAGRGHTFLRGTEMPAVICEPGFGTNPSDAWKLLTRQARLMTAYRHALTEWLREGGDSVKQPPDAFPQTVRPHAEGAPTEGAPTEGAPTERLRTQRPQS